MLEILGNIHTIEDVRTGGNVICELITFKVLRVNEISHREQGI